MSARKAAPPEGGAAIVTSLDNEEWVFGRCVLRLRQRALLMDGVRQEIGSRAFDLLCALVRSGGDLVTKDALFEAAWPGVVVGDDNLYAQIATVRRALGADRDAIATVPGRGYRFTAPSLRRAASAPATEVRGAPAALVLPFRALSSEAGAARVTAAVTDALTVALARALTGVQVVSRTTASVCRDRAMTARQISEEIGVRYVLEGSLATRRDRVRVNAQLIDAVSDAHLWAERFERPCCGDLLAAQDAVVARIARMAEMRILIAEAARAAAGPADPAALALRGRAEVAASRLSPAGAAEARTLFRRALALDPDNPEALAGLATVEAYAAVNGQAGAFERDKGLTAARALAERVLANDPGHLGALRARAVILRAQGHLAEAAASARAVLAERPGDPQACRELGLAHLYLGDTEAAVDRFRQADLSGPRDPARWSWMQGLGRALMQLGRDAEAADALRLAIESRPGWAMGHALLAASLLLAGQTAEAIRRHAEFRALAGDPEAEPPAWRESIPEASAGRIYRERNQRIVDALRRLSEADG